MIRERSVAKYGTKPGPHSCVVCRDERRRWTVSTTAPIGAGSGVVPVSLGLDLLVYSTVLPADLSLCQEVDNPPSMSVTECNDFERSLTVSVRLTEFPEIDGEPVGQNLGWRIVAEGAEVTVEAPVASTWRLRIHANGLTVDEVLGVVESVPVLANRNEFVSDYEIPIAFEDLTDEQLRSIAVGSSDPRVVRSSDNSVTLVGETAEAGGFTLYSGTAQPTDLLNVVSGLGSAQLVAIAERPMIIGSSIGGPAVYWIQRGKIWALLTQSNRDSAAQFAIEASGAIEVLPPRTRNWTVEFLRTTQPEVHLGDRISFEGQLTGSVPEGPIEVYLLTADPLGLTDYRCSATADIDGSFSCTGPPLGSGDGFGPFGAGEHVLAIGEPWLIVPGSNFQIIIP